MTVERLRVSLYNAIGVLEDVERWCVEDILKELGMTAEEYWDIMYGERKK